ncbi:MAG TPA: hypothetical protein PKW73_11180, partial [Candidatus Obscuribacter sp.]|nr:hypothetical protein [Candidatus Obscuribacter sp.]
NRAMTDYLVRHLDLPEPDAARAFVSQLGDAVTFYKIGLELFMAGGYFELLEWLTGKGKKADKVEVKDGAAPAEGAKN